ncbi:MAG TPA: DUF1264 domain-containing protein [candidate division Zixibacteria bacterium]|nr:DUF1264 domain-containing protein [candidate division Zixibacteria bacterium]
MEKRITFLTGFIIIVALISLAVTASSKPVDGFTLHIDAKMHFPSDPDIIAHHYCKTVADGLIECQLYDSDAEDARLVGVETVVSPEIYNTFTDAEKALWHYHKTELPRVDARLPDLTPDDAAKVVKSLEETYGKLYILWDPGKGSLPLGNPGITILDSKPAPAFEAIIAAAALLVAVLIRRR